VVMVADDQLLLAKDGPGLQKLLDVCDQFALERDYVYSVSKSVGTTSAKGESARYQLTLSGKPLPMQSTVKYLGVKVTDARMKGDEQVEYRVGKAQRSVKMLVAIGALRARSLSAVKKVMLLRTMAFNSAEYAFSIGIHTRAGLDAMDDFLNDSVRKFYRARSSKRAFMRMTGVVPAVARKQQLLARQLGKWLRAGETPAGRLTKKMRETKLGAWKHWMKLAPALKQGVGQLTIQRQQQMFHKKLQMKSLSTLVDEVLARTCWKSANKDSRLIRAMRHHWSSAHPLAFMVGGKARLLTAWAVGQFPRHDHRKGICQVDHGGEIRACSRGHLAHCVEAEAQLADILDGEVGRDKDDTAVDVALNGLKDMSTAAGRNHNRATARAVSSVIRQMADQCLPPGALPSDACRSMSWPVMAPDD
jgi:hypothetical protein